MFVLLLNILGRYNEVGVFFFQTLVPHTNCRETSTSKGSCQVFQKTFLPSFNIKGQQIVTVRAVGSEAFHE